MDIFGADHGWGGGGEQKGPPPLNLSHIFGKDQIWYSYTLTKGDLKNI